MKLASFLLLSAVLPVATLASLLPAYGASEAAIVVAQADDPVDAAQKALDAAEKSLSNAEETGGDIRAARRSVANAMKSLRAAEVAAGRVPAQPATPAPVTAAPQPPAVQPAAEPQPTTPAAPAANAPKPYQPPKIEQPAPIKPPAETKPAPSSKPATPPKPAAPAKPPAPAADAPVVIRRGSLTETRQRYPGGVTVVDITDRNNRLVRRIQIAPDGTETVIIDRMRPDRYGDDRELPPRIYDPREVPPPPGFGGGRGGLDGGRASEAEIEGALRGRPVAPGMGGYTLNEIRRSEQLRARVAAVDLDTITFESGSARVSDDQVWKLERIAAALGRVLDRWPNQVFLIEGHTDAVGTRLANQELSDRRAASVAAILNRYFAIPARSLVTQGYGEDYLKVPTDGPSRQNRRVTIRNITPLLSR
ncbi:OmpA family protein [Kaistia soli DSM 19436]|uniref:OmpA family protein n=1 Tax=Kaistia soli DSM 19436 TaxID=1122133 RepID=A0A1M5KBL8_9HYPH|nr:OmpA family protein [Kaistia soli]SHG50314.1 OmpA family protein [Kaistia soli DSM 19436]